MNRHLTPKEKALQLVLKMGLWKNRRTDNKEIEYFSEAQNQYARECALIAVNEFIHGTDGPHKKYWKMVKYEIETL